MKKIYILLLIPFVLFSQSFLLSNIPLPKTYIQNLDPYPCDEECLQDYLDKGMVFSFLAHTNDKISTQAFESIRLDYLSELGISSRVSGVKLRVALLLPYKKIGRYAKSTTNAAFAYLMAKNRPFELKSYKIETESYEDIYKALQEIQKDQFLYVIAPLTQTGEDEIAKIDPKLNIYFPTINIKDANNNSRNLYYGGIDYRAQSDMLLKEAVSPLVIFHDRSSIGKTLTMYQKKKFLEESSVDEDLTKDEPKKVVSFSIPRRTTNLERQLKENEDIVEGSFFINTPIIKSGMIMSQLTLYDTNATNVLSTQTNYNPLLLSMTQYQDRKNMIIANSITEHKDVIIETNELLGNDIVYDWINYTTTIGIDLFFSQINHTPREYDIMIVDNQVIYPIELIQPSLSRFIPYFQASSE
jgi:SRSO17 transposase